MELEKFINKDEVHEAVVQQIVDSICADVERETKKEAKALVSSRIAESVSQLVSDVISNPVQPTNCYGEPKGEPITLREEIIRHTTEFFTKKTYRMRDGHPKVFEVSTYKPTHSGLEALVFPLIQDEIQKEVSKHLGDMVATVKLQAAQAAVNVFSREFGLKK